MRILMFIRCATCEAMRRATKRGDRTEENVPTARRRLSKVAVNEAEEKEWRKQQRDADTEAMPGEDDEEWEDVSDEESDEYGGVDEPLEDEVEEEIVYSDDDDEITLNFSVRQMLLRRG
ncbi:hypothetical protein TRVL_05786 [Trypanosoma vivax]|nr:hypothetical protein TRVL_05786 [Trypanosoma vivax]